MELCPLSMISGEPCVCGRDCRFCPPMDLKAISGEFKAFSHLLNTKPGEPWDVCGGLSDVADAIREHSENVWEVGEAIRGKAKRLDLGSVTP